MLYCAPVSHARILCPLIAGCLVTVAAVPVLSADSPASGGNASVESFSRAKKLLVEIQSGRERTFYCDCPYRGRTPLLEECGYRPVKDGSRARRIEWEHVVPAEAFGQSFAEWRDGHADCVHRGRRFAGRSCARKINREFRRMEADLYNLVPAIGEVNALRSNFPMAMIPGESRRFGSCDLEIAERQIEPRPAVRGDIARIYLYMDGAYPGRGIVSRKQRRLFAAWSAADPVDAWECERARRIRAIQGNANGLVEEACHRLAPRQSTD
jgi:deoxyribonuclease-1